MTLEFKGRREDQRLITGQGRYTSDWNLPGQLHGVFLRADRAHAEIVKLDVEAARAATGVKAVILSADLKKAGVVTPPNPTPFTGRGGTKAISPPRQFLAETKVHYVGQPIALVIADTAYLAEAGRARVVWSSSRLLNRQLSFPVSTMSQ